MAIIFNPPKPSLSHLSQPGVVVSFEHPVYTNGYFLGFEGWDGLNGKFNMRNITYIVRLEFKRKGGFKGRVAKNCFMVSSDLHY